MSARGAVQCTTSIFHFGRSWEEDKQEEEEEEENVWDRENKNGREVIG